MGSPTEFWVGRVLVFPYEDGFTLFLGQDAEFTLYAALLEVIAVATALLLIAKWVRPSTSWLVLLATAAALGAAGMWLGVTSSPWFSPVACLLTALGIPLGLCAFGLAAAVRRVLRAMSMRKAQRPAAPHPRIE